MCVNELFLLRKRLPQPDAKSPSSHFIHHMVSSYIIIYIQYCSICLVFFIAGILIALLKNEIYVTTVRVKLQSSINSALVSWVLGVLVYATVPGCRSPIIGNNEIGAGAVAPSVECLLSIQKVLGWSLAYPLCWDAPITPVVGSSRQEKFKIILRYVKRSRAA